jgi:hypothetical protein
MARVELTGKRPGTFEQLPQHLQEPVLNALTEGSAKQHAGEQRRMGGVAVM